MRPTTSAHRALLMSQPSMVSTEANKTRAAPERVIVVAISLLIDINVNAFAVLVCNSIWEGLLFAALINAFAMEDDCKVGTLAGNVAKTQINSAPSLNESGKSGYFLKTAL